MLPVTLVPKKQERPQYTRQPAMPGPRVGGKMDMDSE